MCVPNDQGNEGVILRYVCGVFGTPALRHPPKPPPPPTPTKEFVWVCLWNKLSVHSRVLVLSGTKACPLCGSKETVSHALGRCRFYTAIKHVLNVYWPTGTQGVSTVDLFPQKNASSTMKSLIDVMVWLASEAFWK